MDPCLRRDDREGKRIMSLNITLAQLNPTLGDIGHNLAKVMEVWRNPPTPTDLIIFPELFLCGYPPEDLVLNFSFLKRIESALAVAIEESKTNKTAIFLPAPYLSDGKIYNAAHFIEGGSIRATITKCHLPNYGVFDEARTFTAGTMPDPVPFRGHKLGFMICEDMWSADVAKHLKDKGANMLIVPNGSPFDTGKRQERLARAHARVKETSLPLIYLNQVGGQDDLVFDGHSFVMDASGTIVLQMDGFTESIKNIPWPLAAAEKTGTEKDELADIYHALILGLRDYTRKNKFSGILLGLSGGIDSALSALIAVDALGAANVHCVMMPSRFTSKDSLEDAAELAKNLNVRYDIIPIEDPVRALNDTLAPHLENAPGVTFENMQSRARGVFLMALSNASGKMVLSTGNKSEMAVGYATLYGDMCGGFNALKDIYKTKVYKLSHWRNAQTPVIPQRMLSKAPTAELRENQKDQDSLPPYDELDKILFNLIEQDLGTEDIIRMGHARETVEKIAGMLGNAEHKRRQSAPGIKITTRAFGRERRYPITNGSR